MAKAVEAFRTISEVAAELAVQKHVLRFWENKFPQVRPMKRGGGRRYYRPDDLDLLRGIRFLLHREGYTIKGVQKILREQGLEHVKSCWQVPTQKRGEAAVSAEVGGPLRKARSAPDRASFVAPAKSAGPDVRPAAIKGAGTPIDAIPKEKSVPPQSAGAKAVRKATAKGVDTLKRVQGLVAELEHCRRVLRGESGERELPKRVSSRVARPGR